MDQETENVKIESWRAQRIKELGFAPQNEQFHNFYLPYYDAKTFDDESNALLQSIKQNLGLAIANREIYPASGVFITQLMKYDKAIFSLCTVTCQRSLLSLQLPEALRIQVHEAGPCSNHSTLVSTNPDRKHRPSQIEQVRIK
jgi:hypothetical protein